VQARPHENREDDKLGIGTPVIGLTNGFARDIIPVGKHSEDGKCILVSMNTYKFLYEKKGQLYDTWRLIKDSSRAFGCGSRVFQGFVEEYEQRWQ
jgi:hypothetical protein